MKNDISSVDISLTTKLENAFSRMRADLKQLDKQALSKSISLYLNSEFIAHKLDIVKEIDKVIETLQALNIVEPSLRNATTLLQEAINIIDSMQVSKSNQKVDCLKNVILTPKK